MKKTISWILCFAMLVSAFSFCMPIFAVEFDSVESVAVIPVAEEDTESTEAVELAGENINHFPDPEFKEWPQSKQNVEATGYPYLVSSVGGFQYSSREKVAGTGEYVPQLCGVRSTTSPAPFPVTIRNTEAYAIDNTASYTLSFDYALIESYGNVPASFKDEPYKLQIFVGPEAKNIASAEQDAAKIETTYGVKLVATKEIANTEAHNVWKNMSFEIPAGLNAKYFYIRLLTDTYMRIDNLSFYGPKGGVVEPNEPVVTNLWPNETFSEVDYTGLFGKYLGNSNGYTQIQAPSFGDAENLCMKLSLDAPFFSNSEPLALVSGTTYVLTFRAAGTNTGTITPSNLQVYTSDVLSNKDYFNFNDSDFTGTKEMILSIETEDTKVWENYEVEFTASDATKYITFFVPQDRQTIYLDDVVLTAKDGSETPNVPVVTNLWYDGGFDNVTVNSENQAQSDDYRILLNDWRNVLKTEENNNFLSVSGSSAGSPAIRNNIALDINASTDYVLTIKLKNTTAGSASKLQVYTSDTVRTDYWSMTASATFEPTDSWDTYTVDFPKGTLKSYLMLRSGAAAISMDDISIVANEPDEPEVPVETNFWPNEKFDTTDGLSVKNGSYNWSREIVADPTDDSNNVMMFYGDGPFIANAEPLNLTNGLEYTLTFRTYATGSDNSAALSVFISSKTAGNSSYLSSSSMLGTFTREDLTFTSTDMAKWVTHEYTFTASDNTKYVTFYSGDYTVYLDDIKITAKKAAGTVSTEIALVAPKAGATAETTLVSGHYNATVAWSPALVDGKFNYGTEYTATVTLTLNANCELPAGADVYTVEGATSVTNADGSNVVTVVFPATAAAKPTYTLLNTNILTNNTNPVTFTNDYSIFTGNMNGASWNVLIESDPDVASNKYLHLKGWAGTFTDAEALNVEAGRPVELKLVYYINNKYSSELSFGLTLNHTDSTSCNAAISTEKNTWAVATYTIKLEEALTQFGIYARGGYNSADTSIMDHTYIDSISLVPYDKVTFYSDADTVYTTEYFLDDEFTFENVPTPSKAGCTFAGWATSADAEEAIDSLKATTAIEDFELYALWTEGSLFTIDEEHYGVRNDKYADGIRIKASFAASELSNMTEVGFVVADAYYLGDADLTLSTSGAASVVLYNGDDKNIIYSNDGTTVEIAVILDFSDVDPYIYDYEFIIRPYAKKNGVTLYGEALTTDLVTYLEATIETSNYENFEFTKDYVDSTLDAYYNS